MSPRAWIVVSILAWCGSVVVAFLLGAWYEANLPPLPGPL